MVAEKVSINTMSKPITAEISSSRKVELAQKCILLLEAEGNMTKEGITGRQIRKILSFAPLLVDWDD